MFFKSLVSMQEAIALRRVSQYFVLRSRAFGHLVFQCASSATLVADDTSWGG